MNEKLSLYTVVLGLVFGVVTVLGNLFKMLSLANGPMHITLLVTTSSMIIPAISGIFFGESFSRQKFCIVILLIIFIYLSISKKNDVRINKQWIMYCISAFVFQGSIGVLQKIHQTSTHREEVNGFLFIAFVCSFIFSRLRLKKNIRELKLEKSTVVFAVICGLCTYCMNYLNLKLCSILPSQLFFPLINGSAIVFSSLMSVVLFKERLSKMQFLGLCGGIGCLIAICIVK